MWWREEVFVQIKATTRQNVSQCPELVLLNLFVGENINFQLKLLVCPLLLATKVKLMSDWENLAEAELGKHNRFGRTGHGDLGMRQLLFRMESERWVVPNVGIAWCNERCEGLQESGGPGCADLK